MEQLIAEINNAQISIKVENNQLKVSGEKARLTPDLLGKIKSNKADLINYLSQKEKAAISRLEHEGEEYYELSLFQREIWLNVELYKGNLYNQARAVVLEGDLNVPAFKKAVKAVIDRYEILRTTFHLIEEEPYQKIHNTEALYRETLQIVKSENDTASMQNAVNWLKERAAESFDLKKGPLIKFILVKLSDSKFLFSIISHHIIMDGWSSQIIENEISSHYLHETKGEPLNLSAPEFHYKEFAAKQNLDLRTGGLAAHKNFWANYLEGDIPRLDFPTDYIRKDIRSFNGKVLPHVIKKDRTEQLKQYCKKNNVTLFIFFQSLIKVLLHRYTGKKDIVVGSVFSGRGTTEMEGQVGSFANVLPVLTKMDDKESFRDLLSKVKDNIFELYTHQFYPFYQVVKDLDLATDARYDALFDVLILVQNFKDAENADTGMGDIKASHLDLGSKATSHDLCFVISENSDSEIVLNTLYNTELFKPWRIRQINEQLEQLVTEILKNDEEQLAKIELLNDRQKFEILHLFNDTSARGISPFESSIELFRQIAEDYPDHDALVSNDTRLSYAELDVKTDQLACYLRDRYGIREGDFVGVLTGRNHHTILSLLAIMKLGAVYMPIEEDFPTSRIEKMCKLAAPKLCILSKDYIGNMPDLPYVQICKIEEASVAYEQKNYEVDHISSGHDAAYIIFTSGSTGTPKPVVANQKGLVNLIYDTIPKMSLTPEDNYLQFMSIGFDGSIFDIFMPLLAGATLVMVDKDIIRDSEKFVAYVDRHQISMTTMTPSYMDKMGLLEFPTIKAILSAGEEISRDVVDYYASRKKIFNGYGPSESTVGATLHLVDPNREYDSIPIGKPFGNRLLYVLDDNLQLLPKGAPGEICISGPGVVDGYYGDGEMTAAKFVKNPFVPGKNLYRTGDLGYWSEAGEMMFLGRKDNQVQLNGYRVELNEIESMLQRTALVKKCVVITNENKPGHKQLIAYIMPGENYTKKDLREYMLINLPKYMVPGLIIEMEDLPLTALGKVDKNALPAPELSQISEEEYFAPQNETERNLASIWENLLGREKISIYDNFFELGGDSIISIQVVSRAKRYGMTIRPKDVFECQTITALAKRAAKNINTVEAEQGLLTGEFDLLPIQSWFFELDYDTPSHFNQSYLFRLKKHIKASHLETVANSLVKHHDAFRLSFSKVDGEWKQTYNSLEIATQNSFDTVDLSRVAADDFQEEVKAVCDRYQRSLNIENAQVFKMLLIKTPESESNNRVFIFAHHLSVDGVSWRILLRQIQESLQALLQGKPIQLDQKTTSFREWVEAMQEYAASDYISAQQSYWETVSSAYTPLPADKETDLDKPIKLQEKATCYSQINSYLTQNLLSNTHQAYETEVNDILLSALGKTIQEWTKENKVMIGLEGHGREYLKHSIDTSNTVGWFTNMYPLHLDLEATDTYPDLVKTVKEQLRRVPNKGLGYGLLRYLQPSKENRARFANDKWDVIFNYLGQSDNVINTDSLLIRAEEAIGQHIGDNFPFSSKLEINSSIENGHLRLSWRYSTRHFEQETIRLLAENFRANLEEIILHCAGKINKERTPFDYGLSPEVGHAELTAFLNAVDENKVARKDKISSIYRLSPLQEGIYFHYLYEPKSKSYLEQLKLDFPEGLDIKAFCGAFQTLLDKHSIFKSSFFANDLSIPVQCVFKDVKIPVTMLDYSDKSESERTQAVQDFLIEDMDDGFDFRIPPLMRLTFIKMDEKAYQLVWTFHHIAIDGWSMPIVFSELEAAYEATVKGERPPATEEDVYEDYIKYIAQSDKYDNERFWKKYLHEFNEVTLLPFVDASLERTKGSGDISSETLKFSPAITKALRKYGKDRQITINSVFQGIWALLLSRYTQKKDVLFGVTVSGRPTDLANSEKRVGLYINAVPLRVNARDEAPIKDWLIDLQKNHTDAREFQYNSLNKIQRWADVQGDLFDSILIFENYPVSENAAEEEPLLKVGDVTRKGQTNYPISIAVTVSKETKIVLGYDRELIAPAHIRMIKDHFEKLFLQIIEDDEVKLGEIDILTGKEQQRLLEELSHAPVQGIDEETMVSLFEEKVIKNPEALAIFCEGRMLTYGDLNDKANKLANYLRLEHQVQPEQLIGLMMERTEWAIVAMLGIWKAGAAYVPIDPNYPQDRKQVLLDDTQLKLLITNASETASYPLATLALETEWENIAEYEAQVETNIIIKAKQLAYVIYTSGSTGKPKGVMIEHGSVKNTIASQVIEFGINEKDRCMEFFPFSFDASILQIFTSLLGGAQLYIISEEVKSDTVLFQNFLKDHAINILTIPPAYLNELDMEELSQSKVLVTGGEALAPSKIKTYLQYGDYFNSYGPTEYSICATCFKIPKGGTLDYPKIPIGRPIANTRAYILDDDGHLLAEGLTGELCIAGAGIASAYWNDPELSERKFVKDPFTAKEGARMYKTGDLARWLPDGNLEFMGRKDDQVKVRGHRVELGEIEKVLQQSEWVNQCVVLLKEKRLVAYVTTTAAQSIEVIKGYLAEQLPDYMLPSVMVELEEMPITSNGKIDKKALPDPATLEQHNEDLVAPRNETEAKLAQVWKDLLNLNQVGVFSNFFELGGDSIITIQVISRLKKLDYFLTPKDLFQYPTIASLAVVIEDNKSGKIETEQGLLEGPVPLLPIQQWFFDNEHAGMHHFNQSILVECDKNLTAVQLRQLTDLLLDQHDALRFKYEKENGVWTQSYGLATDYFSEVELSALDGATCAEKITKQCRSYQENLSIEANELFKVVFIQTPESESKNRLFILAHHLLIDAVSWRIIMEDLNDLINASRKGEEIKLAPKGSSYRQWTNALRELSTSHRISGQANYWSRLVNTYEELPVDMTAEENLSQDMVGYTEQLDSFLTKALLKDVSKAYNTGIEDILLGALAWTISDWSDNPNVIIGLEGHGREDILSNMEVSNTVGWFTNLYPIGLRMERGLMPGDIIKSVKEDLRSIPDKGMGFGLLKYLHPSEEMNQRLANSHWDILFNYLGQIDNGSRNTKNALKFAGESTGKSVGAEYPIQDKFLINCSISNGQLNISWTYSRKQYFPETIEALIQKFMSRLSTLIYHCLEKENTDSTPSDHGLNMDLTYKEFDDLNQLLEEKGAEGDEIFKF